MDTKNPTPKPPSSTPHQSANIAIDEITPYKDGDTIRVSASDIRIYCVKSGSVQRVVMLPGCNGLGLLRLGKIDSKLEGGYWHPQSAILYDQRLGINLEFKAVGETMVQKLTDSGLPKDPGRLKRVIASLLMCQSKQVAETELVIKHQFERAESETAQRKTAEATAEKTETEHDEILEKVIIAEAEQARLQRELNRAEKERDSALAREKVLRGDVKVLRGEVTSLKTSMAKGQASMGRAISETERMRSQLSDQARWIAQKLPDSPEVLAGQAVTNADVDAAFDLIGEMFKPLVVPRPSSKAPPVPFKPRHSPLPPKPQSLASHVSRELTVASDVAKPAQQQPKLAPQTDEPFGSETNGDCEVVRDDELWPAGATELIDMGPAHGFQNDEDASETSRQTIPFEPRPNDPKTPAVVVPPHDRLPVVEMAPTDTANLPAPIFVPAATGSEIVQVTKTHDVRALQRQTDEDLNRTQNWDVVTVPSQAPPSETKGRPWANSQLEDVMDYARRPVADSLPPVPRPKPKKKDD